MDYDKIRAALYIRVSTEEQAAEGQSVDAQIQTLTQYCEIYNIEIYDIYKDLGVSGKSARNRPGLQLMLKDASKGEFNLVLVWKISRLSRSLKDLLLILDQLEKNNIAFTSYSEKFDTSNPVGRMTLQLLGSIAEFERNTIIDNVKLGLREYARKGGKTGTVLGYDNINKQLVVNDQEAQIVKLIFKLYSVNRMSLSEIADILNSHGYSTKRGKKFRKDGIANILNNPTYLGINRHNIGTDKEYQTKGTHQPIIDINIWNLSQELRHSNRLKRPLKAEGSGFILSNKLICKECGSCMTGFSTKAASKTYRYYKCKTCGRLASAARIEEEVTDSLYKLLLNNQIMEDTLNHINNNAASINECMQIEQIQNQIKSCSSQLDKYVALFSTDGLNSSQIIIDKIKDTEKKLSQLYKIKEELQTEKVKVMDKFTKDDYQNIIKNIFDDRSRKEIKQIIDNAIESIEIDNSHRKVKINYTINTSITDFVF